MTELDLILERMSELNVAFKKLNRYLLEINGTSFYLHSTILDLLSWVSFSNRDHKQCCETLLMMRKLLSESEAAAVLNYMLGTPIPYKRNFSVSGVEILIAVFSELCSMSDNDIMIMGIVV